MPRSVGGNISGLNLVGETLVETEWTILGVSFMELPCRRGEVAELARTDVFVELLSGRGVLAELA